MDVNLLRNGLLTLPTLTDANHCLTVFSFQFAYENAEAQIGNTPMFNGNISAMKWSANLGLDDARMKAYTYGYDAMNRITSAAYRTGTGEVSSLSWSVPAGSAFSESGYSYDLNGNIKGLTRKGRDGSNLDVLEYDYGTGSTQSNQLLKVTDTGSKTEGFTEITGEGDDYKYDANGNLLWDKNKGGEEILKNGGFSNGSSNWLVTDTGGRLTFQDDSLNVTAHATASATIRQDNLILKKSVYVVIVDMVRNAGSIQINVGNGGNQSISASGKSVFTRTAGTGDDFVLTIPATFSGQIKSIEVKGVVVISYNHLNLPERIVKGLQQSMQYVYDASGRKISQEVYDENGLITKKSDYEGEFFYENDTLKFLSHEEGRVVMTGGEPEYQYHLQRPSGQCQANIYHKGTGGRKCGDDRGRKR